MFKLIIKAFGLVKDFSNAQECYGKRWFTSKVLWANCLAVLALVLQSKLGYQVLSMEDQTAILAVINIVLRFFTVQPVVAKESSIICRESKNDVPDRQ